MLSKGKKIDLFNILKLTTSYIVQNNYNINISYEEACRNNYVVAIGDNQLLKFIRYIRKIDFNKEEIEALYKERNELKLLPKSKKNYNDICRIQNKINEKLFVPDLISIKTDTAKKDYKYICKNKLNITIKINNHSYSYRYCRICAGAGQLRRNSAFFINEELHDDLIQLMMCGLTRKKIGKINLSKYGAYLALCTSAVRTVRTPRICVVDDFEYTLEKEKVRWITVNEDKSMELDDREIDMEINAFDGSGMVSPEMAKIWADDMKLDYLPASFIIRGPWLKGLCSVFDFHKFAKEVAHKDVIIDHWGKEWPVNEIDVILTTSQFKMYKRYESFDQYIYWYRRYNHSFGISRVSKKNSALQTQLNYQYIQSNSYTPETVKGLADYTINWLKNIMTGDRLYTMLFLIGAKNIDKDISQVVGEISNPYCKALMYDDTILEDNYFRRRINKMITKKVDQAKIGKLFVEGDYEFIIPDLYAMAEHAFGMAPHGLLKSGEMWSKRWNDKGSKEVSIMRSPLVSPCENQVLNLHDDEKCREWYKYIYSGNILNIWDTAAIRMSDADYDGDLALVTDNQYVVNAVDRTLLTITYAKNKTKEQYLNENSCANLDVRSFNSKIGFITNLASNFIAMLPDFSEDSDEYKELKRRIDLLRFYQGSAILTGRIMQ